MCLSQRQEHAAALRPCAEEGYVVLCRIWVVGEARAACGMAPQDRPDLRGERGLEGVLLHEFKEPSLELQLQ